jgi:hypothetical protein
MYAILAKAVVRRQSVNGSFNINPPFDQVHAAKEKQEI